MVLVFCAKTVGFSLTAIQECASWELFRVVSAMEFQDAASVEIPHTWMQQDNVFRYQMQI